MIFLSFLKANHENTKVRKHAKIIMLVIYSAKRIEFRHFHLESAETKNPVNPVNLVEKLFNNCKSADRK
jgi:hypothetical protein